MKLQGIKKSTAEVYKLKFTYRFANFTLEETGEHQGRISIASSWGDWSYWWDGMGKPLKSFLCDIPEHYLVEKFAVPTDKEGLFSEFYNSAWRTFIEALKAEPAQEKKEPCEKCKPLREAVKHKQGVEIKNSTSGVALSMVNINGNAHLFGDCTTHGFDIFFNSEAFTCCPFCGIKFKFDDEG